MTRYVVFSGINGNYQALSRFLQSLSETHRDDVIYLGDTTTKPVYPEKQRHIEHELDTLPDLLRIKSEEDSKGNKHLALVLTDLVAFQTSLRQPGKPLLTIDELIQESEFMNMFPDYRIFFYAGEKKAVHGFSNNDIERRDEYTIRLNPGIRYFISPGSIGNVSVEKTFALYDTEKKLIKFVRL